MDRVRVLIADDHPLFREGVARAIRAWPELELIAEAADGRTALELIRAELPHVALVDMRLPELDGTQVVNAVTRDQLSTRVIVLSAFSDEPIVFRALEAGAAGYLTKASTRDEIACATLSVGRGGTVLAPELAAGLASEIRRRGQIEAPLLTVREKQVLSLLCTGKSAPQIAEQLVLGTPTVKSHLGHLYEKLGVSDRAAAVAEAMRRGLVE